MSDPPKDDIGILVLAQEPIDEKSAGIPLEKDAQVSPNEFVDNDRDSPDVLIISGADVAAHLLPMRDDFDRTLTFRAFVLGSGLAAFLAVMTQIYTVSQRARNLSFLSRQRFSYILSKFKPTPVDISGVFLVLIAYFIGNAWARLLPRGDKLEARWLENGGQGKFPWWISLIKFLNPGPFGLKEHSISVVTAQAAGYVTDATQVFAAQKLFYDLPLNAATVILCIISIGLFGCGLCGFMRPIAVWDVEAVYWGSLPTVKTLQGLHWQQVQKSKPLKYFWYAFTGMSIYEVIPAYIFPWLNSISIPVWIFESVRCNM